MQNLRDLDVSTSKEKDGAPLIADWPADITDYSPFHIENGSKFVLLMDMVDLSVALGEKVLIFRLVVVEVEGTKSDEVSLSVCVCVHMCLHVCISSSVVYRLVDVLQPYTHLVPKPVIELAARSLLCVTVVVGHGVYTATDSCTTYSNLADSSLVDDEISFRTSSKYCALLLLCCAMT